MNNLKKDQVFSLIVVLVLIILFTIISTVYFFVPLRTNIFYGERCYGTFSNSFSDNSVSVLANYEGEWNTTTNPPRCIKKNLERNRDWTASIRNGSDCKVVIPKTDDSPKISVDGSVTVVRKRNHRCDFNRL